MDKAKIFIYQSNFTRKVISGEPGSESVGYLIRYYRDRPYTLHQLLQYILSNVTEFGVIRIKCHDSWQTISYKSGQITTQSEGDWSCLLKNVKAVTANGGFGAIDYNVILSD